MASKVFWILMVLMILMPTGYVFVTGLISVVSYIIGDGDDVLDEDETDDGKEDGVEG